MMTVERAVIVALLATLVGIGYALAVHWMERRHPEHPYTFVLVVAGVGLSLLVALVVVPAVWVMAMVGVFALTGIWQVLGAMYRNVERERKDRLGDAQAIQRVVRAGSPAVSAGGGDDDPA
jgi:hypothetical protein